jgi:peptidoglycan/xylan/chitin deacetylase (PgdA/CDA1 family)
VISTRKLAEAGLVWSGIPRWMARSRRGHSLVLAYHNIVPDDMSPAGDRSLHLPRAAFARQLDVLRSWCDVIPLADLLSETPRDSRPRVAITFDDAYRGALTLGAVELRARRLPATMFVAPGLLGSDGFWWDAVSAPEGLSDAVRSHALGELRGDGEAIRRWVGASSGRVQAVAVWQRPGDESEVETWAREEIFTVGAHSWRHANLARLEPRDVEQELTRPLEWLRRRFSNKVVPWLTYPYGLTSLGVIAGAQVAGYEAALLVSGGWGGRRPVDRYRLPRLNIPAGLTTHGFRLRLAGIVGSVVASTPQVPISGPVVAG